MFAREFQNDTGCSPDVDVGVYVFSFRLYVGDPTGDCLFLERGDVRGFFHYFRVSEHDFHVAFC